MQEDHHKMDQKFIVVFADGTTDYISINAIDSLFRRDGLSKIREIIRSHFTKKLPYMTRKVREIYEGM